MLSDIYEGVFIMKDNLHNYIINNFKPIKFKPANDESFSFYLNFTKFSFQIIFRFK